MPVTARAAVSAGHGRPPLLWEEFTVGAVPQAAGLDGRREKIKSSQSGDIRKVYVLWARAERIPLNEMMLATGLS